MQGHREDTPREGRSEGGVVQHIREKKCFSPQLDFRAMRGLPTEKGEIFPLLNSIFAMVQLLRFFFMGIP